MEWKVYKIINYDQDKLWGEGYAQFGFTDLLGNRYFINHDDNWIGQIAENGSDFTITMGPKVVSKNWPHLYVDLKEPKFLCGCPYTPVSILVSSDNAVYRINLKNKTSEAIITSEKHNIKDIGNCVYDKLGNIWVNEIRGCKIWQFDYNGSLKQVLGDGIPGFQKQPASFKEVRFNWIYDLRAGTDGNIYVLDSKNFCVRMIEINSNTVKLIAGTGEAGYSGDGGDSLEATFGSNSKAKFDGPWSLSLDENDNIYIGDTQNHVIRMVERSTNTIKTIAGKKDVLKKVRNNINETNPMKLNLPLICGLDYVDGKLYIPEWDGDLIILDKN